MARNSLWKLLWLIYYYILLSKIESIYDPNSINHEGVCLSGMIPW